MHDRLPVPTLLGAREPRELTMSYVRGTHGQELIDAHRADLVLRIIGELLAEVQGIPVGLVEEISGSGDVVVHGDFGPQNVLIQLGSPSRVTALLDWEFAHAGERIEDLAWAEWIVRTHHPAKVTHLTSLFDGYGVRPVWGSRQAEMVRRCEELGRFAERQGWTDAVTMWRERTRITATWTE